jgi:HSP20 family molecular chaperone IbpA
MKSLYPRVKEAVNGHRFLAAGELEEWSMADQKAFWSPTCEMVETAAAVKLIVDLPFCGAGDIQLALTPRTIIVKKRVRLLDSPGWKEFWEALRGPAELFRRFEMPASIDVNRLKAELEMGVLTVIAPKRANQEQPARGLPGKPHAFAA